MEPGTIRVAGHASWWVPADHVDLTMTVTRRAATTAEAVAAGSVIYTVLDDLLEAAGNTVVRRTTNSLTVQELVRWDPNTGANVAEGFVATRSEAVRLAPLAAAGDLVRTVMRKVPDVTLTTPVFGVTSDHPAHTAVRSEAAAAARASAAAYASGLNLRLGPVQRLSEPKVRDHGPFGEAAPRMMAKADVPDGGATVLVEIGPEEVEITATVELIIALA